MHYYQFNIGDYAKSTKHLTHLEDLAYRRLLDLYYDSEKPIPEDIEKVARLIGMRDQKTETQQVLEEFFILSKNGYIQKRVKKELDAYSSKASVARANGKKGGRPKKTHNKPSGLNIGTQKKAKQEPLTNNHKPLTIVSEVATLPAKKGTRLDADFKLPSEWGNWALQNTQLTKDQIITEGECFRDYWAAVAGSKGVKLDWAATWRNWIRRSNGGKQSKTFKQIDSEESERKAREFYEGKDEF